MKDLIAKEHHPHLKKRAILEIVGLLVLIGLSINQRELIGTAISAIRESDLLFLGLTFGIYWPLLPLTAISYKMLAYKTIPITTTALSQLAAAGPGRIIPGGLGHISIGAVHLNKLGLNMQRAVLIPVANNLIGMLVNVAIVIFAVATHPSLLKDIGENISVQTIIFLAIVLITVVTLIQWLAHARKTRKAVRRVNNQWKHLAIHIKKHPKRLLVIILIAAVIALGHATMLKLSGEAINVSISLTDAVIALSVGVLFGGAIPTPGGLGAVEAGTTSALILLGYDSTNAASAALLFRTATYWQPLLPGLLSYMYLRERKLL